MNRVVIIVSEGVADYIADDNVKIITIDTDILESGNSLTKEDIAGFEDLVPDWIKEVYIERKIYSIED